MHLPMCRWTDAAALSEFDRLAADLSTRRLSNSDPVAPADKPSRPSTHRHVAVSPGARVRHVRKLSVATGLPIARLGEVGAVELFSWVGLPRLSFRFDKPSVSLPRRGSFAVEFLVSVRNSSRS